MSMTFEIPKSCNSEEYETFTTDKNCVIIIGANGSGKSRLAAEIEKRDFEKDQNSDKRGHRFLRISAQRILNFNSFVPPKNYEGAENKIQFGSEDNPDKNNKWWDKYKRKTSWITAINEDYNDVLAAFIAKINLENKKVADLCIIGKYDEVDKLKESFLISKLQKIWHKVLPERDINIDLESGSVRTSMPGIDDISYNGQEMSDGERVCLYMICQVLCARENLYIIIDEPELHLHPSIMNRLWETLEKARPDCHFIYVTHDTNFATQHADAEIIWVQKYDGKNWTYEQLQSSDIPDHLFLSILGNRKNVLFIEGNGDSWDYKLYSKIFDNYLVIPCQSCHTVIERTKAYRNSNFLHQLKVVGLIDRDYRTQSEINGLANQGIYCLKVAEVENLFMTEELLEYYHREMAFPNGLFDLIKQKVIDKFSTEIDQQICNRVKAEMQYHLSVSNAMKNANTLELIKEQLSTDIIDHVNTFGKQSSKHYHDVLNERIYKNILAEYNNKGLCSVLQEAAIQWKREQGDEGDVIERNSFGDYQKYIVRQLQTNKSQIIIDAIRKYLPDELFR